MQNNALRPVRKVALKVARRKEGEVTIGESVAPSGDFFVTLRATYGRNRAWDCSIHPDVPIESAQFRKEQVEFIVMTAPRLNLGELIGKTVGMLVAYILALFLPAGTLLWPSGWLYIALTSVFSIGLTVWLARYDPALLAERLTGLRQPDRKPWDKVLLPILFVGFVAWLVVIGLDAVRFRWSHLSIFLQGVGVALLLLSFYIFYLTFRENTYLSPAVRIQKERGQKVVDTGPYRYVRHPMYAGVGVYLVGTAMMLGSWMGVIVGFLLIAAVARRAIFEEQTLKQELAGYGDYMKQVRYRLIPGVW